MTDAVRVAVRVRPFIHQYEKQAGVTCCVEMDPASRSTTLIHPETNKRRPFYFDFSYNSFLPPSHPDFASQDVVWNDLGVGVLDAAWQGFNVSLFAYGQTGSGKSYSIMGYPGAEGIVPIACREIFARVRRSDDETLTFKVEASMMEIYNERVHDLFAPGNGGSSGLRVRENPKTGPYVQDLTRNAVASYDGIAALMEAGTAARTVAATAMNATSSRAHTIFQIILTQTKIDRAAAKATDRVSVVNLIDLAGSERSDRTGARGDRLKEGCAINQSLSALGNVISALADKAEGKRGSSAIVVPYRNSKLTHLLKNSLGGNAKTIMIAAISPASINYDETLSTLRYADRAKKIKNRAVVNEDPNQKLIRGLRAEIEELRLQLAKREAQPVSVPPEVGGGEEAADLVAREKEKLRAAMAAEHDAAMKQLKDQLAENERLVAESAKSWQDKLKETEERAKEREAKLAELGLGSAAAGSATPATPAMSKKSLNGGDIGAAEAAEAAWKKRIAAKRRRAAAKRKAVPHIINLNEDPFFSEKLVYFFDGGHKGGNSAGATKGVSKARSRCTTTVGSDKERGVHIVLQGLNVLPRHCEVRTVPPSPDAPKGSPCGVRLYAVSVDSEVGDDNILPPIATPKVSLNGKWLTAKDLEDGAELHRCDRLILGNANVFRVEVPGEGVPEEVISAGFENGRFDWPFAMTELNATELSALTCESEEEKTKREAAEAEAKAMEAKVRALEEAVEEAERARAAEAEANAKAQSEGVVTAEEAEEAKRKADAALSELEKRLAEQQRETAGVPKSHCYLWPSF